MELRVGGKYRLSRKLGCGAFGDIYHGKKYTKIQTDLARLAEYELYKSISFSLLVNRQLACLWLKILISVLIIDNLQILTSFFSLFRH